MSKTKITAPEYPPLTCVEWVDATNVANWMDLKNAIEWATTHDFLCRNVGYLIHEDDDCVVLAARFSPDGDDTQVGLFERLPKGMIVRRWVVDEVAREVDTMGGKPSKGTPADRRIKGNKGKKS